MFLCRYFEFRAGKTLHVSLMCAIIAGSAQFLRSRSNPNKGAPSGSVY